MMELSENELQELYTWVRRWLLQRLMLPPAALATQRGPLPDCRLIRSLSRDQSETSLGISATEVGHPDIPDMFECAAAVLGMAVERRGGRAELLFPQISDDALCDCSADG